MTAAINSALTEAATVTDRIRNDIVFSEVRFGKSAREKEILACLKANAYVWLAAVIEQCVRKVLIAILSEINIRAIPKDQIKYCLLSLAHADELDSIRDSKGLRGWVRRASVYNAVSHPDPVVFNLATLPIDKKTIRAEHLETIWHVFGFTGDFVPHPKHKLALRDLADGRNDLAHGEVDPVTFGRSKAYDDLIRLVGMVDDVLLHLSQAASNYINNNEYMR